MLPSRAFVTVSLTGEQWGICLLGPVVFLAVAELGKLLDRKAAEDASVAVPPRLELAGS